MHLIVVCVLGGLEEGRRGEFMLCARSNDAVPVGGCGGVSHMLVGFAEGCRLHVYGGRGRWTWRGAY